MRGSGHGYTPAGDSSLSGTGGHRLDMATVGSMEGGLLLCRVVRQYVLHDVDLREMADGLPMTSAEVDTDVRLRGRGVGSDVRSTQDCPSCRWPQIVVSSKGCRCRSGIVPSHLWDSGLLELGTAASILAWEAHRVDVAGAAHIHNARWASEFALPVMRHKRVYDHTAVGIWSSGSLTTAQLRPVDSADWQGDGQLS